MKAVQMDKTGSWDVLKYREIETPRPGPSQIRVKTASISVNFADIMLRKGTYLTTPPYPAIPGLECSGTIDAVGENVKDLKAGQPVIVFGPNCYAEYVLAETAQVVPVPEGIDPDDAAALTVNYLTAYHMLHSMAGIEKGQTVLVYAAAGGVGTAVIQLSKPGGFTVIGLTSTDDKQSYAQNQGADHMINYKHEDVTDRIKEITNNFGVDLILNSVAGKTFARDFEVLAPLGQIIWFGFAAGAPKDNLTEIMQNHFSRSVGIRAFVIYSIAQFHPGRMRQSYDVLFRYLKEGTVKPHIQERIPLAEASRAHQLLESGSVTGKLILKP
ncbi:MAG: zinc-binding dehydrogenase [Desulfobacterales bacterium]